MSLLRVVCLCPLFGVHDLSSLFGLPYSFGLWVHGGGNCDWKNVADKCQQLGVHFCLRGIFNSSSLAKFYEHVAFGNFSPPKKTKQNEKTAKDISSWRFQPLVKMGILPKQG